MLIVWFIETMTSIQLNLHLVNINKNTNLIIYSCTKENMHCIVYPFIALEAVVIMVVEFTTTYTTSAYHTNVVSSNST